MSPTIHHHVRGVGDGRGGDGRDNRLLNFPKFLPFNDLCCLCGEEVTYLAFGSIDCILASKALNPAHHRKYRVTL